MLQLLDSYCSLFALPMASKTSLDVGECHLVHHDS